MLMLSMDSVKNNEEAMESVHHCPEGEINPSLMARRQLRSVREAPSITVRQTGGGGKSHRADCGSMVQSKPTTS